MHVLDAVVMVLSPCPVYLVLPPQAVPHVVEIDTTIKIAGGINSPLIVRTTDNYGRVQRQLCKCNDDLRQVSRPQGAVTTATMDCRKVSYNIKFRHWYVMICQIYSECHQQVHRQQPRRYATDDKSRQCRDTPLPHYSPSHNNNRRCSTYAVLQDAVMQQFFGLVDTLLAGSPDSRQRRLGIRTYRVVPCSPLVGVLEWVEGTLPLTEYLLGDRSSNYSGGASGRQVGRVKLQPASAGLCVDMPSKDQSLLSVADVVGAGDAPCMQEKK